MKKYITTVSFLMLAIFVVIMYLYVFKSSPSKNEESFHPESTKNNDIVSKNIQSKTVGGIEDKTLHDSMLQINNESYISDEADLLMDELVEETTANIVRGGPTLGNEDYIQGKTLATKDRAEEYYAFIKPIGDNILFDEFEVTSDEIQKKAETIKMTSMVTLVSSDPNTIEENKKGHDDSVKILPDRINIKKELENKTLSMWVYDQALTGALDSLIDGKILNSFLEKNKLAPKEDSIQINEKWEERGLLLTIYIDGNEYYTEINSGITEEEFYKNKPDIYEGIIKSVRYEVAMGKLKNQNDQIISPNDKQTYFQDDNRLSMFNMTQFLKSKASIDETIPKEMMELKTLNSF